MQEADRAGWQGPSLTLVLGGITLVVIAMGVFAFWRYSESERWVRESLRTIEVQGKNVDAEGCVDASIEWHRTCAANKTLCDNAISLAMYHCLEVRDRKTYCDALPLEAATGGWLMERCRERGNECKVMKHCPCAKAYRALDSFCRSGQSAVQVEL